MLTIVSSYVILDLLQGYEGCMTRYVLSLTLVLAFYKTTLYQILYFNLIMNMIKGEVGDGEKRR